MVLKHHDLADNSLWILMHVVLLAVAEVPSPTQAHVTALFITMLYRCHSEQPPHEHCMHHITTSYSVFINGA